MMKSMVLPAKSAAGAGAAMRMAISATPPPRNIDRCEGIPGSSTNCARSSGV
jgi:hypothetical protein